MDGAIAAAFQVQAMTAPDQLVLFFVSFVANWFSALAGGGSGLIQFPVLIFLGLSFGVALATHKITSVALGLGATLRHAREGRLERRLSLVILGAGLPGVVLGANVILKVPANLAQIALGLLTIGLGLYSALKPELGLLHSPRGHHGAALAAGAAGLFAIGFLNGSLASGTGLFLTMWLIRHFGMDYKRAVAYTLVLCGLAWNGVGAIVLAAIGQVAWNWLPALLAGSLLGGYLGTHYALGKSNLWVKRVFEIVTILVGMKLII